MEMEVHRPLIKNFVFKTYFLFLKESNLFIKIAAVLCVHFFVFLCNYFCFMLFFVHVSMCTYLV